VNMVEKNDIVKNVVDLKYARIIELKGNVESVVDRHSVSIIRERIDVKSVGDLNCVKGINVKKIESQEINMMDIVKHVLWNYFLKMKLS